MAIEMPTPVTDRLPHPDWGTGPAPERRTVAAGALLDALETAGAAPALLAPLRAGAQAGTWLDLLVSPDHSLVQVLLDGRRMPLTGAAREAALALLEPSTPAPSAAAAAAAPAGTRPDADLAARVAAVDAELREARVAGPEAAVEDGPAAAEPLVARFGTPLLQGSAGAAAGRLAQTIEHSGLFLEAHTAQWLAGARDEAQLAAELRALGSAAADGSAVRGPDQRAALQLEALQRQALRLAGPAWEGQELRLEIARDRERPGEAADGHEATGLFQATLALELPRLGTLQARIRVMDRTVGVQIESAHAGALVPGLGALAEALSAHGLSLIELRVAPLAQEA
jgi:hypothetical protein